MTTKEKLLEIHRQEAYELGKKHGKEEYKAELVKKIVTEIKKRGLHLGYKNDILSVIEHIEK